MSMLTQHEQFIKSLSEDQKFALKTYTGASSHRINNFLRGDKTQPSTVEQDLVKHIDSIFTMVPPLETAITVYRGINVMDHTEFIPDNKTFLSTTRNKDVGIKFAGNTCCLLILTIPAGSKALFVESLSYHNDENEVLLNRGGKFTITGVKVRPQTEIFAMYMPETEVSGVNSFFDIMQSLQLQFSKLFIDDKLPAQSNEVSLDLVPKGYVYHPFYKKNIPIDSEENCGVTRASIQKYNLPIKEQLGKICDFLPLSDVEYILGPISYSEHRYNGVNICIFGERHDKNIQCTVNKMSVPFNNFLQSVLLEHKDYFYDFFFEIDYINSESKARNKITNNASMMYLIETDLYDCFQNTKEKCQYSNLRAHYSDPRSYAHTEIIDSIQLMMINKQNPDNDFIMNALEKVANIVFTNKLLLKEYSKSYLGKEIQDFIERRVIKQADVIESSGKLSRIIGPLLVDMYSEIMNAYTLARIFRKFKPSSNQPEDIQNAILYVGEAHAVVIREFIETILEVNPTISIAGGPGCINTSSMKKSVLFAPVKYSQDYSPENKTIYHPFYKQMIPIDSEKNCGVARASIQKYNIPIKKQLGKICDFLPLSAIEYILGPISYSEHRYKDLNICIFGERHDKTIQCTANKMSVPFNNFLQSVLLEHKDYFYDFFFEIDYINSESKSRNKITNNASMMYLIETDLYNCFQNTKERCQYKNLRAHYSDPRSYTNTKIMDSLNLILLGIMQPTYDFIMKVLETSMDIVTSNKLLLKEYAKSYLGQEIKEFIIERVRNQSDAILTYWRVGDSRKMLIYLYAEIMNAYTLARIFRTFKHPASNQPSNIQNAILYVGDAHAVVIREFIETVLGVHPTINIEGPGCISTSTMKKSVLFAPVKYSQDFS